MLKFLLGLLSVIMLILIIYVIGIIPYKKWFRDNSYDTKPDYWLEAPKIFLTGLGTIVVLFIICYFCLLLYLLGDLIIILFK